MTRTATVKLQPETSAALDAIFAENVVNAQSMRVGLDRGEPMLLILDGLLRYAKAYRARMDQPIAEDGFAGTLLVRRSAERAQAALHGRRRGDGNEPHNRQQG